MCPPSGAWLCVVGVNVEHEQLSVLAALAKRFVKDQCKFLYVFADAAGELPNQLRELAGGPASNEATLLVVNRKKRKVQSLRALDEGRARSFLESVFSGTGKWTQYDEHKLPEK